VNPVGAARLHVTGKADFVEQVVDQMGHLDRELEAVVRRIEIEQHEVRAMRLVDPRVPGVHVDAVHLHHPQHALGRVDEWKIHEPRAAFTRMGRELPRLDPRRHAPRRLFLEEDLAPDAVWVALHRERPVPQVRH
jgi:hypothetical protein